MDVEIESTCACGHGKEFLAEVILINTCGGTSPFYIIVSYSDDSVQKTLAFPSPHIPLELWQSESDGFPSAGPPISTNSDSGAFNVDRAAGHDPHTKYPKASKPEMIQ